MSTLTIKRIAKDTALIVFNSSDYFNVAQALSQEWSTLQSLGHGAKVAIDAQCLAHPFPWGELRDAIQAQGLQLLGVSIHDRLKDSLRAANIPVIKLESMANAKEAPTMPADTDASSETPASADIARKTLLIQRQLRSGERVHAHGGDLVIIGSVGHGAEVFADGHIHIYGHLLGRAHAGAKGDTNARIFVQHLDPSLIAIAGIYRLFDGSNQEPLLKKPAMISLQKGSLLIEAIAKA